MTYQPADVLRFLLDHLPPAEGIRTSDTGVVWFGTGAGRSGRGDWSATASITDQGTLVTLTGHWAGPETRRLENPSSGELLITCAELRIPLRDVDQVQHFSAGPAFVHTYTVQVTEVKEGGATTVRDPFRHRHPGTVQSCADAVLGDIIAAGQPDAYVRVQVWASRSTAGTADAEAFVHSPQAAAVLGVRRAAARARKAAKG